MKKALSLATVLALAGCGGGGGGSDASSALPPVTTTQKTAEEPAPVASEPCNVVLYGDSILRGEPLIQEGPSTHMQKVRPSWNISLRAVGGQTGNQGAPAVMDDPRPENPVVVMEWGINDAIQHTDVAPMRALINKVRAEGGRPILTGPAPYAGDVASWFVVNAALNAMASDTGTPWVNWGAAPIQTIDGVHPSQASSDQLVDKLIPFIDAECAK